MANFAPSGIVRIGRVPFDNSYAHTMTFANASSQASFFSSVCSQSLEEGSYTYVRMNNSIKVAFNAERLYAYNYIMYKNRNYGDKWFYAFITGVNYVNERTTELVVELDVMQTWYFDYRLEQCFVEREHVNDDRKWVNLVPEPSFSFNQVMYNPIWDNDFRYRLGNTSDMVAIVQTNGIPVNNEGVMSFVNPWAVRSVAGYMYDGMLQASKFYAWTLEKENITDNLASFLNALNQAGGADTVTSVFMFPRAYMSGLQSGTLSGYEVPYTTGGQTNRKQAFAPPNLDGYVPKNNKLFNFPYTYWCVTDSQGHKAEWKYELWNVKRNVANGSQSFEYCVKCPLCSNSTVMVVPYMYANDLNDEEAPEVMFSMPWNNKVSWVYSASADWQAKNAASTTIGTLVNAVTFATAAGKGISSVVKGGQASRIMSAKHLSDDTRTSLREAAEQSRFEASLAKATALAAGGAEMQNQITQYQASLQPDVVRGNATGDALYAARLSSYRVCAMVPQRQFAKQIDDFFSAYGYQVDALKTPNRTGRRSWNYVKCANCDFHGSVPASHMAVINGIYNSGITFWHTSDIGNYSLDNSII